MKTKRTVEVVGISVALIVVARHFLNKYEDTLKYWRYLYVREEKFRALYLSCRARCIFAKGKQRECLAKDAERYRKKSAWYLKRIGNNLYYEK